MHILVCIKQIIDPEISTDLFRLDPITKRQARGGLSLVISAYDQNALEVALQLREKVGGKITALCLGESGAMGAVKSALGMGVDEGVLLSDARFLDLDVFGVAHVLAQAVRKLGSPGLVLTGAVSGDSGHKVMGPLLAEELGWPCVTFVTRIALQGEHLYLRRIVEDGYEVMETGVPVVASILSDDGNVPRYSKLKDIMAAAKKPVPTWTATDLPLDGNRMRAARLDLHDMLIPEGESHCEWIGGDTPQAKAGQLALRLRELKVI